MKAFDFNIHLPCSGKDLDSRLQDETSMIGSALEKCFLNYKDEIYTPQQIQQPTYDRISQRPQMIQRQPNFFGGENPNSVSQQILKELGGYKPYRQQRQETFTQSMKDFAGMSAQARAAENASWGIFPKNKKSTKGKRVGRPRSK